MNVVILFRYSLLRLAFHEYCPVGVKVFIIASRKSLKADDKEIARLSDVYDYFEAIEDYDNSGELEYLVEEISRTHKIDSLLSFSETDVLRAARLRERLGIRGQDVLSAMFFRDKLTMKRVCQAHGVRVAPFSEVTSPLDILDFVERHGFPVVLKPTMGASSVGVFFLRDRSELDSIFGLGLFDWSKKDWGLMIESFVDGELYHVDGLVLDGVEVCSHPSKYTESRASQHGMGKQGHGERRLRDEKYSQRLNMFRGGVDCGSVTLDAENPSTSGLKAFCSQILKAAPVSGSFAFHAEVFRSSDNQYLLCEIASRPGGAGILDTLGRQVGCDILQLLFLHQLGHKVKISSSPAQCSGTIRVPRREGVLVDFPETCDLPGVVSYFVKGKKGASYLASGHSSDIFAIAGVSCASEKEFENISNVFHDWFSARTVWSDLE